MPSTIVAVFDGCEQAQRALSELQHHGFGCDQVGLAMRNEAFTEQADTLARADVADRGLLPVLLEMGVSHERAGYFTRAFEASRTIVTVTDGGRQQEAVAVLREYGVSEVSEP